MHNGVTYKIRELGQILEEQQHLPTAEQDNRSRALQQEISILLNFPEIIAAHRETFLSTLVTYCERAGAADAANAIKSCLGRDAVAATAQKQPAPKGPF